MGRTPVSEASAPTPAVVGTDQSFSLWEWTGVVAGFTLLTLSLTYPQIRQLATGMNPHYDSLFSTWRLAWIAHQLGRDPLHLFDANIFYPEPGTLSYSDALLLPGLLGAPLIWMGLHPVVVHNLLLLGSFVACGASMYFAVRTETQSMPAAWFAGVVFAFQPYRFAHYAQLELLWAWPIPLGFWALSRLFRRRRVVDGVILGSVVVLQALSCLYYGVFLTAALLILTIVRLLGRPWSEYRSLVKPALAAVLVCVAVVGPYSMPYRATRPLVGTRTAEEAREWTPPLRSYFTTPGKHWLYGPVTGSFPNLEHVLFPGGVAVCFAVMGAVMGKLNGKTDRQRRPRLAYAVLCVVAIDLSLGFNGLTYRVLYDWMWPFHNLRVPARMFVIVSAAMAALGGYAVTRLLERLERPVARRLVPMALVAAVLLESASLPIPLAAVPSAPPVLYHWLKLQPPAVIMEWPLPRADALGITEAPMFMYYSTFHWHRLVNGYSGVYPLSYIELTETVAGFPDSTSVRYLQRIGVRFVILHSRSAPEQYKAVRNRLEGRQELKLLLTTPENEGEAAVYELGRGLE